MPTAYSTEAEASATSVASMLYHDLLNCEEPSYSVVSFHQKHTQLASYGLVRNMQTEISVLQDASL